METYSSRASGSSKSIRGTENSNSVFDKEYDSFYLQRHLFYFLRNVLWHRDNSFPIRVFSRIDNVLLVNEVDHVFLLFQVLRPIYLCSRIWVSFGIFRFRTRLGQRPYGDWVIL